MKTIKKYPKLGDRKFKTFFAFLPFTHSHFDKDFNYVKETRWLEFVTVEYIYSAVNKNNQYSYDWVVAGIK